MTGEHALGPIAFIQGITNQAFDTIQGKHLGLGPRCADQRTALVFQLDPLEWCQLCMTYQVSGCAAWVMHTEEGGHSPLTSQGTLRLNP